uniref:Uncharacterized protein n=1 Tax=Knipowitschia caucasica TaxID=637954 RepID=A0AAV2KGF7_KNICA
MERQHCVTVLLYFTYCLSGGIRLVGSSNNCDWKVELSKCGHSSHLKEAGEVCRELRCDKAVDAGGSGSRSVWLKKVHCRDQGALSQCVKNTPCPQGDAQGAISMQPASDVNWGESLTIRGLYSADFTLAKVKFEDEGVYKCCYEQKISESCRSKKFTVTVDLQVPNISAFSPDQQQWSQSGVEVTRGQRFVIDCSTSACSPEGLFILSFPASNSSITEPSLNHSASFHFPESQQQHQGIYSCVFQITGAGRTYTSPTSAPLMVTVKQPLLPIILPTVAVSLLLLILIGFYFCRRRRRRVAKFVTSTPALNTMTTVNRYEESDDEEEDDYVNAPGGKNEDSSEEPDYVNIGEIRLNSTYRCAGRVEILHNDEWGTVCDDDWDESDAEVVCRQSSCGSAVQAVGQAGLGEGSGQIWLDDVECFGNENSLSLCSHKPFGSHDCGHGEDAGVLCSEFLKQPPQMSVSPLKLTWGQNASVTCSLAGYSGGTFILKRFKQYLLISSSNPAIFILPQVTFDNKGPYHCVYQIDLLDEVFQSPKSDSVVLTVFPPTPSLCVSSPAEGQCTSDIGHVPQGGSFVLLCSVPSDIPEGLFTLSFPGSNSSISEPSVNHSASFHFPEFQQKLQGLYSCVFQLTGASRTYTSQTASIHIIQLPSMVPVAIAVGVSVLPIALVSLLCFWSIRSQGHRSQSTTRAQMNVAGNQDL